MNCVKGFKQKQDQIEFVETKTTSKSSCQKMSKTNKIIKRFQLK